MIANPTKLKLTRAAFAISLKLEGKEGSFKSFKEALDQDLNGNLQEKAQAL